MRIRSPEDCERYLARLEGGEQRARFLPALGTGLLAFCQDLLPEHFERFARALVNVAFNPKAAHRSRLRAVQSTFRPLQRGVALLRSLARARADEYLQRHLEDCLQAFADVIGTDDFGRLGRLLMELAGPAARTASDRIRAVEAAMSTVVSCVALLAELRALQDEQVDDDEPDDPESRRAREEADRELEEMRARFEDERRQTGTDGLAGCN